MEPNTFFLKDLADSLPHPWDDSVREENRTIYARFYSPVSSRQWFVAAYDPENREFFGIVADGRVKVDYFKLDDMYFGRSTMGIVRDLTWKPRLQNQVEAELLAKV